MSSSTRITTTPNRLLSFLLLVVFLCLTVQTSARALGTRTDTDVGVKNETNIHELHQNVAERGEVWLERRFSVERARTEGDEGRRLPRGVENGETRDEDGDTAEGEGQTRGHEAGLRAR